MQSIIFQNNYYFSNNNCISNVDIKKINHVKEYNYSSLSVSKKEKEQLIEELDNLTIRKINSIVKFHKNVYIKVVIKKEIIFFNNGLSDIRYLRKMIVSMKESNEKIVHELYGNDIKKYIENFEKKFKELEYSNFTNRIICSNEIFRNIKYLKFNKETTGFLFHELIGHLLEEDFYNLNNCYIRRTNILFPSWLYIRHETGKYSDSIFVGKLDDRGDYFYDQDLIRDGDIKGIIGKGNYRSSSIYNTPIPRMRTINVSSLQNFITPVLDNILIINKIWTGTTNPITGDITIICDDCYFYTDGVLFMIKDKIFIIGTLKNMIENLIYLDCNNKYKTGKCIKQNQIIDVGVNSPDSIFENKDLLICRK